MPMAVPTKWPASLRLAGNISNGKRRRNGSPLRKEDLLNSTVMSPARPGLCEIACYAPTNHSNEPDHSATSSSEHMPSASTAPTQKTSRRKAVERKRLTVSLPLDLLERSRNTVYWTKGLTLAQLLEQALTCSLDQLERVHGQPFPQRLEDLKGGRPPNSDRTEYADSLRQHTSTE